MTNKNLETTTLEDLVANLAPLVNQLQQSNSLEEKLSLLDSYVKKENFLSSFPSLNLLIANGDAKREFIVKTLLALGQANVVFTCLDHAENKAAALEALITQLWEVELFYSFMGGLAGYYYTVIKLLVDKKKALKANEVAETFERPVGVDIYAMNEQTFAFIAEGLKSFDQIAAIFPVGGAGDRLDLRDEQTEEALPAAYLPFSGFSLLEGLIRDLQAIEFLYWKLFHKQLITPIAMMTSHEKNNEHHIRQICQERHYFGRPSDSFRLFIQPLVPVITVEGNFSLSAPLTLKLKPGGHGVIWKLAYEKGIFDWLKSLHRKKLIVRQINNPIAGTDFGLLAFIGIGIKNNKSFGFSSCDRLLNASEGMLVLSECQTDHGYSYAIKNIEYTDFQAKGIKDHPKEPNSPYSAFPANTNILFADMDCIEKKVQEVAIPGLLINMKNKVPFLDEMGHFKEVYGGRLESMMQNISDSMADESADKLSLEQRDQLSTYVTYGDRRKIISVTKNKYSPDKSLAETPEGCFYDQMSNNHELFTLCGMKLPVMPTPQEFMDKGPSFIIRYHPALGPLYQIITQKIHGGILTEGSELLLEIAELNIAQLTLQGSLHIAALHPLGNFDQQGTLCYSEKNGKCHLENVTVVNKGIDWQPPNRYWKNEIAYLEKLEIILHGDAEFYASGVSFIGGMRIEVPAGYRLEVTMKEGAVEYKKTKMATPTWQWGYQLGSQGISLKRIL